VYVPENHLDLDFGWELFKLASISGFPVAILFYAIEIFIPFVDNAKLYEKKCIEKDGYVYTISQDKICLKKDSIIKIE
jgi:hypothetical protein